MIETINLWSAGPYFITAITNRLVWCDSRVVDGDFNSHTVPAIGATPIDLTSATQGNYQFVSSPDADIIRIQDVTNPQAVFTLNVTNPSLSYWDTADSQEITNGTPDFDNSS